MYYGNNDYDEKLLVTIKSTWETPIVIVINALNLLCLLIKFPITFEKKRAFCPRQHYVINHKPLVIFFKHPSHQGLYTF